MWEGDEDDDRFRNTAGTAAFMSPEMCTGKDFSGKVSKPTPTCPRHSQAAPEPLSHSHDTPLLSQQRVDVWACGITLYMMLYGRVPFMAKVLPLIYKKIQNDEVEYPDTKFGPLDPLAHDCLQLLLEKDPEKRPTIEQVRVSGSSKSSGSPSRLSPLVCVT